MENLLSVSSEDEFESSSGFDVALNEEHEERAEMLKLSMSDQQCIEKQKKVKMAYVRSNTDLFSENQERKVFAVRERATAYKQRLENSKISLDNANKYVEDEIARLKLEWPVLFGANPVKYYVHVDLDSFYASVESLSHPEYKDIPLGVGSYLMLATCNYKAREYGVRAGMPGYMAKDLCPQILIVKPNFQLYNYYSELVMEILSSYDRSIEIYGIDEACLIFDEDKLIKAYKFFNEDKRNGRSADKNLEGQWEYLKYEEFSFESVFKLVEKIRSVVFRNTKLTISAGVSVCRGFAKFSSKINKPNGQFMICKDFDSHILDLEVDEINGIGKFTKEALEKTLNIKYIKDLRESLPKCALIFKTKTFSNLLRLSFGLSVFDSLFIGKKLNEKAKSHGSSYSIAPTTDYKDILFHLWNMTEILSRRVSKTHYCGLTLTIQIKFLNFHTITKRKKCSKLLVTHVEIFDTAYELLCQTFKKDPVSGALIFEDPVRMIGVSLSDLVDFNEINLLEKFPSKKVEFESQICLICNKEFVNVNLVDFEMHVNLCLDKIEFENKKRKSTLLEYFKKI